MTAMPHQDISRLVLRNDLAELEHLVGWIEGSTQQDVSEEISFAVQFCLEEAVANVIMHGAARNERLEITVELERQGKTVIARVEDNGRHFDPTKAPPPAEASSLKDVRIGHLGIHLMHNVANEMDYERRDGRNRLTLRFVESQPAS
jgi:anti-sigma regulatory factor (Ser/Thr protein kinase)